MNEKSPTFIAAVPPALQGEPRFEVKFFINANKQLVISVFDIKMNQIINEQQTVITLS
jgi:hypothetical protein